MPKREHQPRRLAPSRGLRTRILVFCGGKRTEPAYFEGLRELARAYGKVLAVQARGVAPAKLVALAARVTGDNPGFYDETWCVFDADEFELGSVAARAAEAGIRLAVSNPCFELWLVLHHDEHHAVVSADKISERLKQLVPRYDKTRLRFQDFATGVEMAAARAQKLEPSGDRHEVNPSTGMWRLVERIVQ